MCHVIMFRRYPVNPRARRNPACSVSSVQVGLLNVIHELSTRRSWRYEKASSNTVMELAPGNRIGDYLARFWGDEDVQWLHPNVVLHLGDRISLLSDDRNRSKGEHSASIGQRKCPLCHSHNLVLVFFCLVVLTGGLSA